MRFVNDQVLNAADASTNQTSSQVDTSYIVCSSVHAVVTGTAVGTLKLQCSNDPNPPSNWSDVPSASVSITGAGAFLIPKQDVSYQWVRVVFTNSSGTGTITARLKSIGF